MGSRLGVLIVSLACSAAWMGCTPADGPSSTHVSIEVLAHDGTDAERRVLRRQVEAFNQQNPQIQATLRLVAEGDYNDELQAIAASGDLPDVVEVDGPNLATYAWSNALVPLDDLLPAAVLDAQLPSLQAQGRYQDHIYSIGVFDSGLGMFADRAALERAGLRWPRSPDEAWSAREFQQVLAALARRDPDGRVLDVKLNYGPGEWLTYGFAPLVASAGGELIDPTTLSPLGRLDGTPTLAALRTVQSWARFIDPNSRDRAFVTRAVPLSWVGHWAYAEYAAALQDDLLLLPLPDLGNGTKTGQGSWSWTVTATDDSHQQAAATFLTYLVTTEEVLRMTAANGGVPGTTEALRASALYREGGPLHLFADQLLRSCGATAPNRQCVAVPRPATPGYNTLTNQFAHAVSNALQGKDPGPALANATTIVQQDLDANDSYQ